MKLVKFDFEKKGGLSLERLVDMDNDAINHAHKTEDNEVYFSLRANNGNCRYGVTIPAEMVAKIVKVAVGPVFESEEE